MMNLREQSNKIPMHSAYVNLASVENPLWFEYKDHSHKKIEIIRKPNSNSVSNLNFNSKNKHFGNSTSKSQNMMDEDKNDIAV
jgi:hypothetical protein